MIIDEIGFQTRVEGCGKSVQSVCNRTLARSVYQPEFIAFKFAGLFSLINSTCGLGIESCTFCRFGRDISASDEERERVRGALESNETPEEKS